MKRVLPLLLAAVMLLAASSCSLIFDREVYEETPYEAVPEAVDAEDMGNGMISNYAALRRAISRLVSERVESAVLSFQDYDGSISEDISAACWEVKSSTALGAFAVDYISYDLSRIVGYYQAEVHITYKRSEHQMDALEEVGSLTAMWTRLDAALREGESYLVLSLTAAGLTADTVRTGVERAYYADPAACPVLPGAEVSLYPETGVNRIAEITLDYGLDGEALAQRRTELSDALDAMAEAITPAEDADIVGMLYDYLAGLCAWDENAGDTAWDALTRGTASSEGMAMAMLAGCRRLGLDAGLVFGRLDGEDHVWNSVTIGDAAYHVDVTRGTGDDAVLLLGDEDIQGRYWWDTGEVVTSARAYGASEEPAAEIAETDA